MNIQTLTVAQASRDLAEKKYSAVELAEAVLARSKETAELNAYREVFDDVLAQARDADKKRAGGVGGKLCGIPIAIKDNILINGRGVSASSKILENYTATYDADVIERLKKEGIVFLGRTNMDEFAMGSSTENSAFGVTKNPHDETRVPGGSSGGSAAVVAAGSALASLGSDTGGSIRQPASFCGVVGLKPTYGMVSRYGLIALGSSLDQIGPLTKTVEDAETLFHAIAGYDSRESTSIPEERRITPSENNRRIGVPRHLLTSGIDADVLKNFNDSIEKFKLLGYKIVDIELPHAAYALPVYYIVMPAEASTNLERFDGVRFGLHSEGESLVEDYAQTRGQGFGKEVRRRIMLGTYVLSAGYYDAYYQKAEAVRRLITEDFKKAFESVDCIATPTSPTPAFKIGEKTTDPLSMYLSDVFTVTANLAGIPGLSLPGGVVMRDSVSLPVGLQLLAPHFGEQILFDAGKEFEASV
jgi:aspartyl-tRNA(Asn)/glutamyl-tRNA(Gln) amidotransferase subunit A